MAGNRSGGGGASRPMSATSPASMRPPHRERPDGAGKGQLYKAISKQNRKGNPPIPSSFFFFRPCQIIGFSL